MKNARGSLFLRRQEGFFGGHPRFFFRKFISSFAVGNAPCFADGMFDSNFVNRCSPTASFPNIVLLAQPRVRAIFLRESECDSSASAHSRAGQKYFAIANFLTQVYESFDEPSRKSFVGDILLGREYDI